MTSAELKILVDIMKEKITNNLPQTMDNIENYVPQIERELLLFAGNTIANFFRGKGKTIEYKEMLYDVCDEKGLEVEKNWSQSVLEDYLFSHYWSLIDDGMTPKNKSDFYKSFDVYSDNIVRKRRLVQYAKAQMILENVFGLTEKSLIEIGLTWGSEALATALSISNPVALGIDVLWKGFSASGPAYSVTIPSTLYICSMRQAFMNSFIIDDDDVLEDRENLTLEKGKISVDENGVSKEITLLTENILPRFENNFEASNYNLNDWREIPVMKNQKKGAYYYDSKTLVRDKDGNKIMVWIGRKNDNDDYALIQIDSDKKMYSFCDVRNFTGEPIKNFFSDNVEASYILHKVLAK